MHDMKSKTDNNFIFYVGLCLVAWGLLFDSPLSWDTWAVAFGNLIIIYASVIEKNWKLATITVVMCIVQLVRIQTGGLTL